MSVWAIIALVIVGIVVVPVVLLFLLFFFLEIAFVFDWLVHHKRNYYSENKGRWYPDYNKIKALEEKAHQKKIVRIRKRNKVLKDLPIEWVEELI